MAVELPEYVRNKMSDIECQSICKENVSKYVRWKIESVIIIPL